VQRAQKVVGDAGVVEDLPRDDQIVAGAGEHPGLELHERLFQAPRGGAEPMIEFGAEGEAAIPKPPYERLVDVADAADRRVRCEAGGEQPAEVVEV